MRRFALLAPLVLALAAVPAASASVKVGISDQLPSTFTNPLYAGLHLTQARFVTPYDVMSRPGDKSVLAHWVTAAEAAGQRPLIAFETSHKRGHERKLPSIKGYSAALRSFRRAYPEIKDIQPWNEVNRCQRRGPDGYVVGQPTCHNPKIAAQYYMAARHVFPGARITGLDILDQKNVSSSVKFVKKFLRYAKPRPRYWGIHNYADTNRFSSSRTRALLKATRKGEVWLTETGGFVNFGHSFPYSTKRAAKALGCMFTIAKSNRRISRLYVYAFNGQVARSNPTVFDSGLINLNGSKRPGYTVVQKRKAGACHR